jgi:hypothetical protein
MTRATDSTISRSPSPSDNPGHVCPFCGLLREVTEEFDPSTPCPRCTLSDTSTTRNATRSRVGPWSVRQNRNPWAPGMRFETLLALVKRGQVTRDSVVRGPTTHQLWKRAADVKGLSREFGLCYSCGGEIDTQSTLCAHCNRLQEPPMNPDVLVETRESSQSVTPQSMTPSTPAQANSQFTPASTAPVPVAPVAAPAPARSVPVAAPAPARPSVPAPAKPRAAEPVGDPPNIEISSGPLADPDQMLAATDDTDQLARQITSRPPARMRSLRPRTATSSTPDDALLTPQELATAFQLNFSPPGDNHPRGSRGKLAVIGLLIGGGVATLMYFRPDMRHKSTAWGEQTVASIKTFIESRTTPTTGPNTTPSTKAKTPPAVQPAPSSNSAIAQREDVPATKPHRAPIVIAPAAEAPPKSVAVAEAPPIPLETPAPSPVVQPKAPAATKQDSAQVATQVVKPEALKPDALRPEPLKPEPITPEPITREPIKAEPAKQEPVVKPAQPTAPVVLNAYDEAKRLWGKAIDAEANQDFVEAVNCYEKIRALPADVHPPGLEVRLELARKLTK